MRAFRNYRMAASGLQGGGPGESPGKNAAGQRDPMPLPLAVGMREQPADAGLLRGCGRRIGRGENTLIVDHQRVGRVHHGRDLPAAERLYVRLIMLRTQQAAQYCTD